LRVDRGGGACGADGIVISSTERSIMDFADSVSICVRKYVTFSGRASRPEYWWFVLAAILGALLAAAFDCAALGVQGRLSALYFLAIFAPMISVTVRRLHDTGRSGWWWWLYFVPLIGSIAMLIFMCLKPEPMPNRFGSPSAA